MFQIFSVTLLPPGFRPALLARPALPCPVAALQTRLFLACQVGYAWLCRHVQAILSGRKKEANDSLASFASQPSLSPILLYLDEHVVKVLDAGNATPPAMDDLANRRIIGFRSLFLVDYNPIIFWDFK